MIFNKKDQGKKARDDGYDAEAKAVLFLKIKRYKILERNFKPPRGTGAGEIDIIALKKCTVVFVEVKYRADETTAAEAVTEKVRQRRIRGAEYYLMLHPEYVSREIRFDVILMSPKKLPNHIKNAFGL